MTRGQTDWLVAFGLVAIGAMDEATVGTELYFNVRVMTICERCGRGYFNTCMNCTYRRGWKMPEEDNQPAPDDAFEGLARLHGDVREVARTIRWMNNYETND